MANYNAEDENMLGVEAQHQAMNRGETELPEFIRGWTAPFHVTMDGIKDANGCWICSATNHKLATQIVELMNYAAALSTPIAAGSGDATKALQARLWNASGELAAHGGFDNHCRTIDEAAAALSTAGAAENELHAISAAIGSVRFMDPPDGGSVTLAEHVSRMRQALESAEAAALAAKPIIEALIAQEYNVETWGLRSRLAAIDAALASPPSDTEEKVRTVAWLIERRLPADGLEPEQVGWYAENRLGFHWWTPDAKLAKHFPTRADAEAFSAYMMIASDPTISLTEHVFLGANR